VGVASAQDPCVEMKRSLSSDAWCDSHFENAGVAGRVNRASRYGPSPVGEALLIGIISGIISFSAANSRCRGCEEES
jgi:predicted alpha/beta hydrolase family esterase